jgi:formate dehydrogenase major subunit
MKHKCDEVLHLKSYYHFILAVNHCIISNKLYNRMYIDDNCDGFDDYIKSMIAKDFKELVSASGVSADSIKRFAADFTGHINPVLIFSEKEICPDTAIEIRNLAILAGKLGRRSSGVVCLKENCNSQGLIDAGVSPSRLPGNREISDADAVAKLEKRWGVNSLPLNVSGMKSKMGGGDFSNIFIFGEDPVGCAKDRDTVVKMLSAAGFMVVQDYSLTDTALLADLVLPASYPFETGGSFTSTQRYLQRFEQQMISPVELNNLHQLSVLLEKLGVVNDPNPDRILDELFGLFEQQSDREVLRTTDGAGKPARFLNGADALSMQFDKFFSKEMGK